MNITEFAGLSVVLTGFDMDIIHPDFDTQHMAQEYLDVLNRTDLVDPATLGLLTQTWNSIAANTPPAGQESAVRQQIISNSNPKIGRLAQNIIYMWYLATWYQLDLPPGAFPSNSFVVSSKAYKNSLVWGITGGHPMGYSEGEFGYWNTPPALAAI